RVLDASIEVAPHGSRDSVTASAEGLRVTGGVIEARGLRVTGLGEPLELDARIGNGQWNVRAKSSGVDLRRVARLTGIKELTMLPEDTRAELDVDVRQGRAGADGHFDVVVRSDKGYTGNNAIVVSAHGDLEHGKLVANAKIAADGFGQIEMTHAEVDVPRQLD